MIPMAIGSKKLRVWTQHPHLLVDQRHSGHNDQPTR